jgi:hypothetical protein
MYKDVTKTSRILKEHTIMKTILLIALFMGFGAVNMAMASQEINHSEGKEKWALFLSVMPTRWMTWSVS